MRLLRRLFFAVSLCVVGLVGWLLLTHPATPLPREWNPTKRLYVSDPVTILTSFKLDVAAADPRLCQQVLGAADVAFRGLAPLRASAQCHVEDHVNFQRAGQARLAPVNTSCAIALRTAMWERHGLQPAAQEHLGTGISEITHFSSYNCRQIRTLAGTARRMSTHATAEAIDISGFALADGRRLVMKRDWNRELPFFKAARDSACDWFETTLGPDYNALHADHFHLQSKGWGTCR